MCGEWVLGVWSAAGFIWWLISWRLVAAEGERSPVVASVETRRVMLSIFKPLPLLGAGGLSALEAGLESFISQLDGRTELLLGIHEADREVTASFLERMRANFLEAEIQVVFRSGPDEVANPKIAWQKILAPHARGELWLWSDADIIAPPGFIAGARDEFARGGAAMLTFPYVVRGMMDAPALLDALYVNAEFYPGVLLLRRMGPVDFGLGAGMLFRRSAFLQKTDFAELGASLADDFLLGQRLRPVRLSRLTLETVAGENCWPDAVRHYLRWSKTVRWNRPLGAAARVTVLPLMGWLTAIILHPTAIGAWMGLGAIMQMDVFFAALICGDLGVKVKARDFLVMEAWSVGRVITWLACWLPWPVTWRGRRWSGPNSSHKSIVEKTLTKN